MLTYCSRVGSNKSHQQGTMRILHLSADYPDPIDAAKPHAIFNLLRLAPDHDHRVFSLNRTSFKQRCTGQVFRDDVSDTHRAIRYPALPKGIRQGHYLDMLAGWITDECQSSRYRPDLIHAHKLTVEGIVGWKLARHFRVPLVISAQGDADLKIARAKPGLRRSFAEVWHQAGVALPFAPWTRNELNTLLGQRAGPTLELPCPGPADEMIEPTLAPPVIRTAFNLQDHRNKNAEGLFRAIGLVARQRPQIVLEVIGAGDAQTLALLQKNANRHAPGHVRFRGAVAHSNMQALLNTSAAFALISHCESFGRVFAEALLAGTPCLIPEGRAIDGYLDEGEVTLCADPSNVNDIARQLLRLVREQRQFKERLRQSQHDGKLDFLRRDAIAAVYANALELARSTLLKPQFSESVAATPAFQPLPVSA